MQKNEYEFDPQISGKKARKKYGTDFPQNHQINKAQNISVPWRPILLRVSVLVAGEGVLSLKIAAKKWVGWVCGLVCRRGRLIHRG